MRYFVILALILLPGLVGWSQYRLDDRELALGKVATEIAKRPVEIRCQGIGSALLDATNLAGKVEFDHGGAPSSVAVLKRDVCRSLRRFDRARGDRSFDCVLRVERCKRSVARVANAVHVLTHEAWHLRGYATEAATECYALQTTAFTAQRLGATRTQARAIARWNLKHVHPYLPGEYHSSDCRDGGRLDMRPDTTLWP